MTAVTTLPWGRPLDADEFLALDVPADGRRYELVDGVLLVTPSPFVQHQRVVRQLVEALVPVCPTDLEVFGSPLDVRLSDRTVVEPDVLVVRADDARGQRLTGVPVLCVEVLSDSTRGHDLLLKRERYQTAGVGSYWVVDPVSLELVVWEADEDGTYHEALRADLTQGPAHVERPFPVTLDLR